MQDRMEEDRINPQLGEDRINPQLGEDRINPQLREDRINPQLREDRKRLLDRERELSDYRRLLEEQQTEFDAYRKRMKEDQFEREREFQNELEARDQMFAQREKQLASRQRDFEQHLLQRQQETELLRERLHVEIVDRESKLQQALIDLEREKDRYNEESRKKIERTSKDYVADALDILDRKESEFHQISKRWSAIGAVSLIAAIGFFAFITLSSVINLPNPITWEFLAFSVFKGLIAVALLAGLTSSTPFRQNFGFFGVVCH